MGKIMGKIMEYPEIDETVWAKVTIDKNICEVKGKITGIILVPKTLNSNITTYIISIGNRYFEVSSADVTRMLQSYTGKS